MHNFSSRLLRTQAVEQSSAMVRQFHHRVCLRACSIASTSEVYASRTSGREPCRRNCSSHLINSPEFHQLRPLMACWPAEVGKMVLRSELTRGKGIPSSHSGLTLSPWSNMVSSLCAFSRSQTNFIAWCCQSAVIVLGCFAKSLTDRTMLLMEKLVGSCRSRL
ncbi:hypothetical protein BDV37DRAFT_37125 [Aspergillus pseudonomiae]|uniref:Uncharacterized protein n=1 Tax=Aspergillus pseudonomiae TaxID=1506151 RepID=A0A5N7CWL9_9EURO|nr:uncharacterized protein BDV37DRAFT_37125 [Aspergillus pseudonomiae]KAE8398157.1 hypothetical protein BDV37DRAFT_37125 [Aspergillus pseudonomiae]